jgi:large subunit ribosomal protein L24
MKKFRIKSGDNVKVIAGSNKGESGVVKSIDTKNNRAIVEGVNLVTKHMKPTPNNPQGSLLKVEAALHISNLMLVDPKSGETTRVGRKLNDNGKLIRFAKKSGEVLS